MAEPTTDAPKYATSRDYYVDHLLGGAQSSRLELDREYYAAEFSAPSPTPLAEFLQRHPGAMHSRSVQLAALIGMDFFNRHNQEVRPNAVERGYLEAASLAINGYLISDRADDFSVDQLPFEVEAALPEEELREVGRLAVQKFKVYEAVVATGEVPEL